MTPSRLQKSIKLENFYKLKSELNPRLLVSKMIVLPVEPFLFIRLQLKSDIKRSRATDTFVGFDMPTTLSKKRG